VGVSLKTYLESQPLHATPVPASGVVVVSVAIPESAGRGAEAVVSSVTVAGQHVTGGQALPARLQVIRGMYTPLRIKDAAKTTMSTPAITLGGTLDAPREGSPDVVLVAADGTRLPSLPIEAFGLSSLTRSAAFIDATSTLLLADDSSKLVAVDAASRAVRWSAALGGRCYGIAVLPAQGVVVVSDYLNSKLHVHRLSDGVRAASAKAKEAMYFAADPASGTLYSSTGAFPPCEVSALPPTGPHAHAEGYEGDRPGCRPVWLSPCCV
jgi:hypothetical protein